MQQEVITEIYLDCTHVDEAFSRRIHLHLALDSLRSLAYRCMPLLLMLLLRGHWDRFFPHFEYAEKVRTGDDDVAKCAARVRGRAGVGERGWSQVETCCIFDAAGRQDFLAKSMHLRDTVRVARRLRRQPAQGHE